MFPCSGADDVDINRLIEDYRNINTAFSNNTHHSCTTRESKLKQLFV